MKKISKKRVRTKKPTLARVRWLKRQMELCHDGSGLNFHMKTSELLPVLDLAIERLEKKR